MPEMFNFSHYPHSDRIGEDDEFLVHTPRQRFVKVFMRFLPLLCVLLLGGIALGILMAPHDRAPEIPGTPAPTPSPTPTPAPRLAEAVTREGITAHLQALQSVAEANGGNRAMCTPGHAASLEYVRQQLLGSGLVLETQPFEVTSNIISTEMPPEMAILGEGILASLPPLKAGDDFALLSNSGFDGDDFALLSNSGFGNLTGQTVGVSNEGCARDDYASLEQSGSATKIAVVRRGKCTFREKMDLAALAGASAMIVFNSGSSAGIFRGTLGSEGDISSYIPCLGVPSALGLLLQISPTLVRITITGSRTTRTLTNLIASTPPPPPGAPPAPPGSTIVVGAHLDSRG
ncbi:hypothetical protein T484DRAFT_1795353 [Baffinella frigidus]|nr:hypothetical protein T484DRAFT_1795353 [Cryptophyta sp. CCMP2293]